MKNKIQLRKIYNEIVAKFPNINHSEKRFLAHVIAFLKRDKSRTRSTVKEISKLKLDWEINKDWPLNDFVYGGVSYMKEISILQKEAENFARDYLFNKDYMYKD